MADGEPPAQQPPHAVPPVPPMQPPAPPTQPDVPPAQPAVLTVQTSPVLQLNWPHFKPEFVRKLDKDVEAHLLRTNDWMGTHAFPDGCQSSKILFNFRRRS